MGKKACPDHEIDKLTSWWVRASKTHPRRIIFFWWFSDSDYHSTHDITPYHSINFSLQFIIPASRSSGKEFGPTWNWKHFFLSHAHLPVANGSFLKKCLVLSYVKSFETQNKRSIICGNNGLTLTQFSLTNFLEKRETSWTMRSMQVVVMSSVITAIMMSNPEVQANWRKMYPSPIPAIPRSDDNRKHLIQQITLALVLMIKPTAPKTPDRFIYLHILCC